MGYIILDTNGRPRIKINLNSEVLFDFDGEVRYWVNTMDVGNYPPYVQVVQSWFNKSSLSYTGEYMMFGAVASGARNNNCGTGHWIRDDPSQTSCSAVSSTGQYQLTCATGVGRIFVSNDYGSTFPNSGTTTNMISGLKDCDMSDSGQYQLVVGLDGRLPDEYFLTSNDYGVTWNTFSSYQYDSQSCCVSGDGKYQWVFYYIGGGTYSDDYGATWGGLPGGPATSNDSSISETGKYLISTNSSGVHVSNDSGVTWSNPLNGVYFNCDMSSDGRIMIAGTNTSVYISVDYGITWVLQTNPLVIGGTVVGVSGNGEVFLVGADAGSVLDTLRIGNIR